MKGEPLSIKTDLLALGMFEGKGLPDSLKAADERLEGALAAAVRLNDFTGKAGTSVLFYSPRAAARRVLLIGLGDRKKAGADQLRRAAALAASKAADLKAAHLTTALHGEFLSKDLTAEAAGKAVAEGLLFGGYRYDEYMNSEENGADRGPARIRAVVAYASEAQTRALRRGVAAGQILGRAQNYARTLANRPPNAVTPATLAAEAKALARSYASLKCTVFRERELREKKMGGILAAGQGSANGPRLIVLKYTPAGRPKGSPIALVGKAITFDSGGISLKPSEGMQDMKFDMSGGVAVLGAMQALAQLEPKSVVYGLIPSAENMPGGKSWRPGDIVTTYGGKTVEILSTDAEGRLILCDALHYAATDLGCSPVVDIATLTGACVVAIGTKRAGLMGNDDGLIEALQAASKRTGERVWCLPCDDEYVEAVKSRIADLKNTGGKWAGACTAAAFLSRFVGKARWAHIDMAGVGVWGAGDKDAPGSIGFGVRLLSEFVMNR